METFAQLLLILVAISIPTYLFLKARSIQKEIDVIKQTYFFIEENDTGLVALVITDGFNRPLVGSVIHVDYLMVPPGTKIMPFKVRVISEESSLHTNKLFYCKIEKI